MYQSEDKRIVSNKSDRGFTPFVRGDYFLVLKRTERVVAALVVLSDILPQQNPIGHRLKNLGSELVTCTVSSSVFYGDRDSLSKEYIRNLLEITSLLEVGFLSGNLSEMNYKVISSEIDRLISDSEGLSGRDVSHSSPVADVKVTRSISSAYKTETEQVKSKLFSALFSKGHPKGHSIGHSTTKSKRAVSYSKQSDKSSVDKIKDREDRKQLILSSLEGGKKLSIKDFLEIIPSISEKTIQRDLSDMISSNVLKREGERRWCRYFIA